MLVILSNVRLNCPSSRTILRSLVPPSFYFSSSVVGTGGAGDCVACFGGCIGGGGQPVPTTERIREQRAKALYSIDAATNLKLANENPTVKKAYEEFLTNEKIIKKVCHTKYRQKKKEVKFDQFLPPIKLLPWKR